MAGRINFKLKMKHVETTMKDFIVPSPIRYSTIGRAELLEQAAADGSITRGVLEQTFDAILHEMEQMLCNGHGLEFGDLGTFRFGIDMKSWPEAQYGKVSAEDVKRKRIIFTPTPQTYKDMKECAKVITENQYGLPD